MLKPITASKLEAIEAAESRRCRDLVARSRRQNWADLLGQCGVRYADATFENYEADTELQRMVVASLRHHVIACDRHGVLLFGPSGTGKDHLLIALAREAITAGLESICWVNGRDLFGESRDRMDGDQSEFSLVCKYTAPQVLILSDPEPPIGTVTAHQADLLYRIVDRRNRNLKATWVTMNVVDGKDAEGRLGVKIVDRLRDDALALFCNWPSYRKTLN